MMQGLGSVIESRLFQFVASRKDIAEAVEDVAELKKRAMVNLIVAGLLMVAPIGIWQGFGKKSQWINLGCGVVSLWASSRAVKANGQIPEVDELRKAEKHLKLEREKQKLVVAYCPELAPAKNRGEVEGDFLQAVGNQGIVVDTFGKIVGPRILRVKFKPRGEVGIQELSRIMDRVQLGMALDEIPLVTPGSGTSAGYLVCDFKRSDPEFPKLDKYLIPGFFPSGTPITMPLGISVDGQLETVELADPNTAHWLIGGQTGSGKSEFQLSCLRWWMQWHPRDVQIFVVDAKQVTYTGFENIERIKQIAEYGNLGIEQAETLFPDLVKADDFCRKFKAWLPMGVITDSSVALKLFKALSEEFAERKQLFRQLGGAKNLTEFNQRIEKLGRPELRLPQIVVLVDEYLVLTADTKQKKEFEEVLKVMAAEIRALGGTLVFASQRWSIETIPPIMRSQFGGRAGGLMDKQTSRITLDMMEEGDTTGGCCAALYGKGDFWIKKGTQLFRSQMPYWDSKNLPANPYEEKPAATKSEAVEKPQPKVEPVEPIARESVAEPVLPVETIVELVKPEPVEVVEDVRSMLARIYQGPDATGEVESSAVKTEGVTLPGTERFSTESVSQQGEVSVSESIVAEEIKARELYLRYRKWREKGKAPYKFIENEYGRGSSENRQAFENQIAHHIEVWIEELGTNGMDVGKIVKLIWNYAPTKAKPEGDEKYQNAMKLVKQVLGDTSGK